MPSHKRRNVGALRALCAQPDEDDGIDPREDRRRALAAGHKPDRKIWQLCKQVAQTVQLAMGALPQAGTLAGVTVQTVTPAPHAGRLRVILTVPDAQQQAAVLAVVQRHAGRLRSEVAAAITRRRAPELTFDVIVAGGADV